VVYSYPEHTFVIFSASRFVIMTMYSTLKFKSLGSVRNQYFIMQGHIKSDISLRSLKRIVTIYSSKEPEQKYIVYTNKSSKPAH